MEKNDDGENGSSSIESTVTLNSSSPRSLGMIRCMQAALMLPSLRTRSAEKDDDGYHKVFFLPLPRLREARSSIALIQSDPSSPLDLIEDQNSLVYVCVNR